MNSAWDPVLKLYLLNFVLAGSVNSTWDPHKKYRRAKQCKRVATQSQPKLSYV